MPYLEFIILFNYLTIYFIYKVLMTLKKTMKYIKLGNLKKELMINLIMYSVMFIKKNILLSNKN